MADLSEEKLTADALFLCSIPSPFRNFSFLFFLSPTFVGREVSIGSNIGISPPHHPPREGKRSIWASRSFVLKHPRQSHLAEENKEKKSSSSSSHFKIQYKKANPPAIVLTKEPWCVGMPWRSHTKGAQNIWLFSPPPKKKFLFTGNGQKNKAKGVAGANSATKKVTLRAFFCSKTVSL